jgi:hypothetical protein
VINSRFFLHRSLVASSNRWPRELSAGADFLLSLLFVWSAPRSAQTPAGLSKREVFVPCCCSLRSHCARSWFPKLSKRWPAESSLLSAVFAHVCCGLLGESWCDS